MRKDLDRRGFMKRSVAASAGAALGFGFEEKVLAAQADAPSPAASSSAEAKSMPVGKIGDLAIGRLICGGNLIAGFAHSRDLIYVSDLLNQYNTDEKVMETFEICERNGINAAILRMDQHTLQVLNKYWRKRGGALQWIAQVKATVKDLTSEVNQAIENGAAAVFLHGGVGETFLERGQVESIGEIVEYIRDAGVPAGVAAHDLKVVMACEERKVNPDFYMKTINSKNYWSAGPMPRKDSVWAETPEETIAYMEKVDKPWIGYKVLGAGAIQPRQGFQYALENGADFLCVGMFDFQVDEDAAIARATLEKLGDRKRPWCG